MSPHNRVGSTGAAAAGRGRALINHFRARVSSSFVSIQIWDLPGGQLDPTAWNLGFADMDAVIFVLDAQSTLNDMIRKLAVTMQKAFDANPGIQFEIFLHKIDGMSEDYRLGRPPHRHRPSLSARAWSTDHLDTHRHVTKSARSIDRRVVRHVTRSRVVDERILPPNVGFRHLDLRGAVESYPEAATRTSHA